MKIDWKAEAKYQRDQFFGMFHDIHKDIGITLTLMVCTAGPIFAVMFLIDRIVKAL